MESLVNFKDSVDALIKDKENLENEVRRFEQKVSNQKKVLLELRNETEKISLLKKNLESDISLERQGILAEIAKKKSEADRLLSQAVEAEKESKEMRTKLESEIKSLEFRKKEVEVLRKILEDKLLLLSKTIKDIS